MFLGEDMDAYCPKCKVMVMVSDRNDDFVECNQCNAVFDPSTSSLHPLELNKIHRCPSCEGVGYPWNLDFKLSECEDCHRIFDPQTGQLRPLESAARLHLN